VLPKRALIRIVRGPDGVKIDPKGKAPGRGAYLHDRRSCWDAGLSGSLEHALKARLTPEESQALSAFRDGLTEGQDG
jgi:predicted RNA-binding protein YlxR (DUF448 family)